MNGKALQEKLEQHLFDNPEQSPIYIEAIAKALNSYKGSIKLERDAQTMNALSNVSGFISKKDVVKYPYALIEFFFILFPQGTPVFHSKASRDIFEVFRQRMTELGTDALDHVKMIFSPDIHKWLISVVQTKTIT